MGQRIKIGVGGRFHADRLASALLEKGWDVSLVTSLPKSRFKGVPAEVVESELFPEILFRLAARWNSGWASDLKMKFFGNAFSRSCAKDKTAPILLAWSGFAVEAFQKNPKSFKVLVRDSMHILEQVEILEKEYRSLGIPFHDHRKVIERELEEYRLADKIVVISKAAKDSFLKRGIPESKLSIVRLGAALEVFESTEARKKQVGPLKIVYFGTVSVRKGVLYLLRAVEQFTSKQVQLTCIGSIEPEMKKIVQKFEQVEFLPPMKHQALAKRLREFDVFVMPSLEDGFGLVIPQAMAAGLVPIVSVAAGASELIEDGKTGILIPPRDANAIAKAVQTFIDHPGKLDEIRSTIEKNKTQLSWEFYADDFDTILRDGLNRKAHRDPAALK